MTDPLIWICFLIFLPLVGGILGYCFKRYLQIVNLTSVGFSLAVAVLLLISYTSPIRYHWEWLPKFHLSIVIDQISLLLVTLVLFIALLVQFFSTEYMRSEKGIARFYGKLGFFIFAMLGLLLADNLLLLFVFWELVGLASYLLIGFWYYKDGIPKAARIAFMVNRVADAALLSGILLVYDQAQILSISDLNGTFTLLSSLLIAFGAFGKSAQLPYSGWLTKAMVGPTPVSALIHAATMVAAGVYLLFRVAPLMHEKAMLLVAVIGTLTAFYAACCALVQFDLKKVLAYSTISQLGYMTLGIGVGAREASLFHLLTHAFFKAGLFLAAASIIHFLHHVSKQDAQDMRYMGGLRQKIKWTYWSFLFCGLALAGLPLFSGFMSKDGILLGAWAFATEHGGWAYLIPDLGLITALITAFYAARMLLLVFWGESRTVMQHGFRESARFFVPTLMLALLSIWLFYHWNPFAHHAHFFSMLGIKDAVFAGGGELIPFLATLMAGVGTVLGYAFFKPDSTYAKNFSILPIPSSLGMNMLFRGLALTDLYAYLGKYIYRFSMLLAFIDQKLINPLLHLFAIGSVVFSKVLALLDRFLVDGPVNFIARAAAFLGRRLAGLSAREGQVQFASLLVILILILIWTFFF
ncbi:MAG: NADH-quinone oxidoreductase subunit L [Bacteroidota bacterium]